MDRPVSEMKSMKLYEQVERIHNELRALGIDEESPLDVSDLTPFDQYHYHGTEACDEAIALLGLTPESRVLEVGAGIGGPARYIADSARCHVTALELQPDLNATAADLTARCRIAGDVDHVCGNMLEGPFRDAGFDALTSLLCFLHIPDRSSLFAECFAALKPGGRIYIEDFSKLAEPSEAQWEYGARAGTETPWWTGQEPVSLAEAHAANLADLTAEARNKAYPSTEEWLDDGYTVHAPVGTFSANPFGLHDTIGNMHEWCRDTMEHWQRSSPRPGDGLHTGNRKVYTTRGGSFGDVSGVARSSSRFGWPPEERVHLIGLRASRVVE